jgi:hypothetical protein
MFVICVGIFGEIRQALAVLPDHVDLAGTGHETKLAGQLEAIEGNLLALGRPCRMDLI